MQVKLQKWLGHLGMVLELLQQGSAVQRGQALAFLTPALLEVLRQR